MKKVLKNSLFYFLVLTFALGNSFVSISFDFATKIAKAQTEELGNNTGKPDKYSVCHANGSGEFQKLNIAQEALGGHFDNNGTSLAGHEDDVLLGVDNENTLQCPIDPAPYPVPVVSATSTDSGVLVNWKQINDSRFYQYKVVISKNNPNPAYPSDGYYPPVIGDNTIVSRLVDDSSVYQSGDFGDYIECGQAYYFSVTARYTENDTKTSATIVEPVNIPGNSVYLQYNCPSEETSVCGNGIVEKTETCDDGNITNEYCGDESTQNGTYCNADCSQELALSEQCDEGSNGSQTCSSQCMFIQEECSDEDNLIVNNSFEEPVVTDAALWQKMASVNGWNIKKASDASATTLEFHKGWSGNVAADGLQYVELDGDQSTKISQNITTEAGAEYKLFWSFAARHGISAEQNKLSVVLDGVQVATNGPATGNAPLAQSDWTASNYVFTADSTNTEISFKDIGPSDSYGTYLDNVRLCKVKDAEPETHYAPWCSALLGALKAYYNPQSPAYLVYNNVIDINNDEAVNLTDTALITTLYYNGNNVDCYDNFENPSSETREFYFQCEDPNVGWCEGLVQGVGDFLGTTTEDKNYSAMYDLNSDGVINLSDVAIVSSLNDETECYTHYVPPFEMCENPEPSNPQTPWCSALLGALKAYYNPQSPVYLVYNNVIDINNDELINLTDTALITTLYNEANDANCYANFENPTGETREFYFQCEDPNVGWCEGLVQGVGDFLGTTSADKGFPSMYDLNDDGVIDLSDVALVSSLNDETECYTHYSPPFLMCENPEPSCGNGILEEGEYCDGEAGLVEGYHCTDSCTLEANQPPACVTNCGGGGGGGSNPPDVNNVLASASCQNTQIAWSTSKDSLTWIVYGETTGFGSEYKSTNFSSGHTISFDTLKPNTTYYYQIKTLGNDNKSGQDSVRLFTTPSAESCGQVLGDKVEDDGPVPPQVLGDKEYTCDRGNRGVDTDIAGVFNFSDGSLIREECDAGMGVYIIRDQQKWRIPNWDYLHKYLEGQRIYNVDHRVIGLYKDWAGKVSGVKEYPEGSLLRSKAGKIYVIESGRKRHVSSLEELKKYSGREIFDVNDAVINQY